MSDGYSPDSDSPKHKWKGSGILLIVLASILWSTSAFFARSPQLSVWPQGERASILSFWRAVFALTLMLPMVRKPKLSWSLLPMVLCFAAMNWTYLTALTGGPPANAIWLQNTAPVWVMLVGVFVFKEKAIKRDWWMLGFCAAGVGLILAFQLMQETSSEAWLAAFYGLLSGVLYAGVVLSLRMQREVDSAWLIVLNHLGTALVMAPAALMNPRWPEGSAWLLLIGFGMLQMGLPYLLFAKGLKTVPGHLASVLTLLEPILLPLWVHLAWRHTPDYQPPTIWTLLGGGLILIGLLVRFLPLASEKNA